MHKCQYGEINVVEVHVLIGNRMFKKIKHLDECKPLENKSIMNTKRTLHKEWVFHEGFLQQMWPNPQETADLVTLTEEILNRKLHFLCIEMNRAQNIQIRVCKYKAVV